EIAVPIRQYPDAMQLVGNEDPGLDGERQALAYVVQCAAQGIAYGALGEQGLPLMRHHSEEIRSTRLALSKVIRHMGPVRSPERRRAALAAVVADRDGG